ncbi:MAG: LCP family protein [Lachnospiraceae bacterium]|nr:LCP family protein [Lachnospiraceae bacterium]
MNNNENEMERIRLGLEEFLYETEKKEVDVIGAKKKAPEHRPARRPEGRSEGERRPVRRPVQREIQTDLAGERPMRPRPQRRPRTEREDVNLDLAPNPDSVEVDRRQVKRDLKEAKKLVKEQQKVQKLRAKANALKSANEAPKDSKPKKSKNKGGGDGDFEEPKKKGKGFKIFIVLLCILAVAWCFGMTKVYEKMRYAPIESLESAPLKDNGVVNILLIGSDSRDETDEGRSDAMILMSISNKTHTIQMTSFLRDMYVDIPGHDGNRLNAAYAFGGPELLMATIKQNFDIEVNRYVVVNFKAFANLVDAVGGVKLELSNDEVQWVNAYLNEYNLLQGLPIDNDYLDASLSGEIDLDGPQALAYSRNRYIGTDFGRTERQRKVLSAVIKKLPKGILTNPKGIIDGLFPNLTTNLSRGEFIYLSTVGWKMVAYDMEQNMIPLQGTYSDANIRGMAVLQVDFEANKKVLKEKIYGEK